MKIKKLISFTVLLGISVALTGCTNNKKGGQKPHSRGNPYELVLIVPRGLYNGELRDSLDAVLRASTPVLPQHEPLFRLNVVYTEANLTPWRTYRNRLLVEISTDAIEPRFEMARNAISLPQIEVRLQAASAHALALYLNQVKEELVDVFVEHELDIEAANLRRKHSRSTLLSLRELSGHSICVPVGLKSSKHSEDFLWTGTNLNDKDQNFVFYSYPWNGQLLSDSQFVEKRDSAMQRNIPGSRSDQWMQTARDPESHHPLITSRQRILSNSYCLEVHGLWEMRNGALGGPFVSIERIDTLNRRVLVTEGFIYSPYTPKRNILRQMEAALRTFK
ncbi:MAG: DUF4837 family protein [Bacteroidaceae bacterium]|nr:DUF4837 family protein [Bacteroidaceae bacterium]